MKRTQISFVHSWARDADALLLEFHNLDPEAPRYWAFLWFREEFNMPYLITWHPRRI